MSKTKNKCLFNDAWLSDSRFSDWLKSTHNKWQAYCSFCQKTFDVSNMGVSSLVSHAVGKKHSQVQNSRSLNVGAAYFVKSNTGKAKTSHEKDSASQESQKSQRTVESLLVPVSTIQAEVLWTLKLASSHFSLRSCMGLNELFRSMSKDSEVAKSFQLSKTKCSYILNYGLAPYFKDILLKEIKESDCFGVSFDQSMNKVLQEEQMDVQIRYWNETTKQVDTRYIDSQFLRRPNAQNLFDCLIASLKDLPYKRLLQLSMDGPTTNWSVLTMLHNDRCEKEYPKTIDIGSCSLHVLHGAFKSGVESTDWSLNKILKAMWRIFDDSPARRNIYMKICEVDEFPLRFCTTRWIEDESVVKRAIKLWPNIIKVINHWQSLCKSKRPKNNKSYETLVGHHLDEAIPVKMQFFQDVASELKGFLQLFQTNNPMVPFLEKALVDVLHTLMQMVVKPDVLDQANSSFKLIKLDLTNSENLLPCELMKLPTATKSLLRSTNLKNEKKRSFLKNAKKMIVVLVQKVQERCPLQYQFARCASSLSPYNMGSDKKKCVEDFDRLVDKLYNLNRILSKHADEAKKEYFQLISSAQNEYKDAFLCFDQKKSRLDSFFVELMHGNAKYRKCWTVFKIVFILSHGQAAVEREFSVNKELLVENLQQTSLISQRLICDYVSYFSKPIPEIPLTNDLMKSCRLARSRYVAVLEEKRNETVSLEKSRKRKFKLEEIAEVKEKKRALEGAIKSLETDIEAYSIAAEKENDMTLLTKANSFRVTVGQKKETLSSLENILVKLNEEHKQM